MTKSESLAQLIVSEHEAAAARLASTNAEITAADAEIAAMKERRAGLESSGARLEGRLRNLLVLDRALAVPSAEFTALAARLAGLRAEAADTATLTVVRQGQVATEIREALKALQSACPHSLAVHFEGYDGSPSDDYEDAKPDRRFCLACGLTEEQRHGMSEQEQSVLTTGTRMEARARCFIRLRRGGNCLVLYSWQNREAYAERLKALGLKHEFGDELTLSHDEVLGVVLADGAIKTLHDELADKQAADGAGAARRRKPRRPRAK
jgi:hypothetical protein